MKHDNYNSYMLSTLLEPCYLALILSLWIANLVSCDFHNLLECSKYALHIWTFPHNTYFFLMARPLCVSAHGSFVLCHYEPSSSLALMIWFSLPLTHMPLSLVGGSPQTWCILSSLILLHSSSYLSFRCSLVQRQKNRILVFNLQVHRGIPQDGGFVGRVSQRSRTRRCKEHETLDRLGPQYA